MKLFIFYVDDKCKPQHPVCIGFNSLSELLWSANKFWTKASSSAWMWLLQQQEQSCARDGPKHNTNQRLTHTQRSEKRLERRIPAQLMHNTEREPNKTISKQAGKVKQNSSSRCREAPNAGVFSPDADLLCHETARPPGLLGPNLRCRLSLRKCSGEKTYDVLYWSWGSSSKFISLHLFIVMFVLHCCFYCSVCTDVAQSSNSN